MDRIPAVNPYRTFSLFPNDSMQNRSYNLLPTAAVPILSLAAAGFAILELAQPICQYSYHASHLQLNYIVKKRTAPPHSEQRNTKDSYPTSRDGTPFITRQREGLAITNYSSDVSSTVLPSALGDAP